MKRLLFLILLGFCHSLATYADGWVIIDTVGIVNIEIEVDYSDRSERQLTKVARKVHKAAKTLNQQAMRDRIFPKIHLHETGINGKISIGGNFEMEKDPPQPIRLSILLSAELFNEETVMKLYRYAVSIKDQLYSEEIENLVDSCVLKRAGIIP
mgnify:CR=1 FL=1